jgi:xanthine dehydrogenase YagS FAD-binding subunit
MKPFRYQQAASCADAVTSVAGRAGAVYLAGGTNLVDHLKLGVATPDVIVDISRLPLDSIHATEDGGLRIGAGVRNSDLASNHAVRRHYPALSQALLAGASGQIRNAATTAGNLLQRTRCVYFQDVTTPCNKREPGSGCPAREGFHRNLAVLGASEHCVATHPSDMAVALLALDAVVVVLGSDGERRVPMAQLHRLPGDRPEQDTTLAQGDLITHVELPAPSPRRSAYRKVRDRASYAFALVSVAAALEVENGMVRDVRIALGGVAHRPWRATRAEDVLRGLPATEQSFRAAATAELGQAVPLRDNAFKVPLARNAITATLRVLAGGTR